MRLRALAALILAPLAACSAHVTSNVRVDGAPFQPKTCVSGQARGFPGIELGDAQGNRLRLATNVDGSTSVAYFTPARAGGEALGTCASLAVQQGTGVVNGVRNLDGAATLACQSPRRQIEGALRFENCH
jgi:hypothetical protein